MLAADAIAWTKETGGDLFGVWQHPPVIYLATRAGPAAVRDATHFRLDVDYLRSLSENLAAGWALRYLGDWHSHHRLGLAMPSGGDRRRISQVARRNGFPGMAEIIVTLGDSPVVAQLHPWVYANGETTNPVAASLLILPGLSPVREALIARNAFPEQEMGRWSEIPAERIVAVRQETEGAEPALLRGELVERLLDHASLALGDASGHSVERHATPFGAILAVPVDDTRLVGFAVSGEWPCQILEVDWINRAEGTAEPIALPLPTSLRVPAEIVALYHAAHRLRADSGGHGRCGPERNAID